jgi:HTH-type transcriptional regulator, competence development regulator
MPGQGEVIVAARGMVLGEAVGIGGVQVLPKVENGRLPPPAADTIVALCAALGVPAEELLALTGKIPSQVQQTLSKSKAAQQFLREAQQMALTDEEWAHLAQSLHRLREEM